MIKSYPWARLRRPTNVFYGWWIVTISLAVDALKHGTFNRGFTIYVDPIRHQMGFGVAAISLAEMLGRMEGGIQGPIMGYLTDRFGPGFMLAFGGMMSGVGFILLSFTNNYLYFLLIFVGFLSLGMRAGYNNATMPAVNNWFRRRRSLAMSVASIGNGLGGTAIPPLLALLVISLGWQTLAFISGIVILAVVVPLSFLVRRSPESMGLQPDGDSAQASPVYTSAQQPSDDGEVTGGHAPAPVMRPVRQTAPEVDFTAKEAMRTSSYWLLVLSVGLRNTVHSGMQFLLAPVMVWFLMSGGRESDQSLLIAGLFVGAMSFCSMVFNPFVGWLGDKWSKQRLSAVAMLTGAVALLVLLDGSGRLWQLGLFIVLLAMSETANPLAWAIMGDFFGRRSFATLRGWQHLPDQLMSMSTPVWMGLIFDKTESYYWALLPLIGIYCLSAFFYWTIPRPKVPARLRRE